MAPRYGNALEAYERHFGTLAGTVYSPMLPPYTEPLRFIGARKVDGPRPHWHVCTLGFSEYDAKETSNAERSGFGFELSLRFVVRDGDGDAPPPWIDALLQRLARLVFWSQQAPTDEQWLRFDTTRPWGLDGKPIRVLVPRDGFGGAPAPLEFTRDGGPLHRMFHGLRTSRMGHDGEPPTGEAIAWANPFADRVTGMVLFPDPALPSIETTNGAIRILTGLAVISESPLDAALAERARTRWADGIIPRVFDDLQIA